MRCADKLTFVNGLNRAERSEAFSLEPARKASTAMNALRHTSSRYVALQIEGSRSLQKTDSVKSFM